MNTYIFDFDGTLVNSITTIAYYANKALNKFGLPSIPEERYKILVGDGAVNLVKRMLDEVGTDQSFFNKVYPEYCDTYDKDSSYLTEPYEGIMEMLKKLKENNCNIAIVSNKPEPTTKKICDEIFGDLIDICRGQVEGCPIKPDPTAVLEVIKQFDVRKSDCVYCGDTITDMETGKNAGLYTVGVLWGFRDINELQRANPDLIISHPLEILKTTEL